MALRRNPDGSVTQMGGQVGGRGMAPRGGDVNQPLRTAAAPMPSGYGNYGRQAAPPPLTGAWGGNTQSPSERVGGTFGNAQQGYQIGPNGVKYWGYNNVAIGGHSVGSSAPAHDPLAPANAVALMGGGGYGGYGGVRGGAGITPGGGGTGRVAGAGGGAGDLASLLQRYQDRANADNEGRYVEGKGIITGGQADQLSELSAGRNRQNAIAGSISETALTREQRRTQQESAATTARLYGMGLSKTTGAIMANEGVLDRGAEREAAVGDQGKRLQLGIEQNYDSSLQNTLPSNRRELTNWIYNKDVQGPDVGLYANLLSRAGANGASGYGGYGGIRPGGGGGARRGGGGFNLSAGGDSGYNGDQNVNGAGYGGGSRGGGSLSGGIPFQSGAGLYDQYGGGGTPGGWDPALNQGSNYAGGDPFDLGGGGAGGGGYAQYEPSSLADQVSGTVTGGASSYGGYGGGGADQLIGGAGGGVAADPNSPQNQAQTAGVPVGSIVIGPDGRQWRKGPSGQFYPA